MKTFSIHTLGCKVNIYESDAMAESLRKAGFEERPFDEDCDVCIINTCTVTNIADRKSRQMLRRARRLHPGALIVAAGCYVDDASRNGALMELIGEGVIDLAVSNSDKARIAGFVIEALHFDEEIPGSIDEESGAGATEARAGGTDLSCGDLYVSEPGSHTRAFIKVQDGCDMFCSYCVIPYVRGHMQVKPPEETLSEIRSLAAAGIAEVVLTGIHLSSMGDSLISLAYEVSRIEGVQRVRLGSLEPTFITRERVARMRDIPKLCPHYHLSLQSGSARVLMAMNRHYTPERYLESCEILREFYEHPAITTDIIVGFPGETEEEFEETLAFVERAAFYEAHVFKFSPRKGTPAYDMPGQQSDKVKSLRSKRLISLTENLSHEFRSYYLGRELCFLAESLVSIGGETYVSGFTPEYVRCVKRSENLVPNELIKGKSLQIVQEIFMDESLIIL